MAEGDLGQADAGGVAGLGEVGDHAAGGIGDVEEVAGRVVAVGGLIDVVQELLPGHGDIAAGVVGVEEVAGHRLKTCATNCATNGDGGEPALRVLRAPGEAMGGRAAGAVVIVFHVGVIGIGDEGEPVKVVVGVGDGDAAGVAFGDEVAAEVVGPSVVAVRARDIGQLIQPIISKGFENR